MLFATCLFSAQSVASHVVSEPDASSSESFVVPGGQEVQILFNTCSLAAHFVAAQTVFAPNDASSPAALVVPAAQEVQTLLSTYSLA